MAKAKRVGWPEDVATAVLTKCHHRCCICPEHRPVANIHHIDEDPSHSIEDNGVGLCGECHPDVHTTSTMRRGITQDQIRVYKVRWEKACSYLSLYLTSFGKEYRNCYYMNVHRLAGLFREIEGRSLFDNIPHRYPPVEGSYETLWPNPKNTLGFIELGVNRNYFEGCLRQISERLIVYDLNLFELGAISVDDKLGHLVSFTCQFIGQDIPDQEELVESQGLIDGPPPTMRRTVTDFEQGSIFESCLLIDPRYMYADSSFIAFSEQGIWNGIARIVKNRQAVGSNDGPLLRNQFVLSPICIGTPQAAAGISRVGAAVKDPTEGYRKLLESSR